MTEQKPPSHSPGDAGLVSGKIRELTRLIRETRLGEDTPPLAGRAANDAARKLRALSRLDALSHYLGPIYSEIPEVMSGYNTSSSDNFTFALMPGAPARFWVDVNTFIVMGEDAETYRLMRDKNGHVEMLLQSPRIERIADAVADYVAERLVGSIVLAEQRSVLEGQYSAFQTDTRPPSAYQPVETSTQLNKHQTASKEHQPPVATPNPLAPVVSPNPPIVVQQAPAKTDWVKVTLAFLLGVVLGGVILFAVAWNQAPVAG